jgi:hypothetical protein
LKAEIPWWVIDSNQYGTDDGVATRTWGATFVVDDVFKAAEVLPVGPAYVTANEEVAEEITDDFCGMETWEGVAATRLTSRANAKWTSSIFADRSSKM